ncbi:unnamed protein product [marine sediment metagenome]|uniref:Uncharacterized protein n=1 Tax=marine sediment metagenome TaxID=412755 RepID=X1VEA8_9ZZZZ
MLLTPEKIKQAIEEVHKKNPGKILAVIEIYEAIAQAQYNEDMKEANDDTNKSSHNTAKSGC